MENLKKKLGDMVVALSTGGAALYSWAGGVVQDYGASCVIAGAALMIGGVILHIRKGKG